jgi:hypothetical protein
MRELGGRRGPPRQRARPLGPGWRSVSVRGPAPRSGRGGRDAAIRRAGASSVPVPRAAVDPPVVRRGVASRRTKLPTMPGRCARASARTVRGASSHSKGRRPTRAAPRGVSAARAGGSGLGSRGRCGRGRDSPPGPRGSQAPSCRARGPSDPQLRRSSGGDLPGSCSPALGGATQRLLELANDPEVAQRAEAVAHLERDVAGLAARDRRPPPVPYPRSRPRLRAGAGSPTAARSEQGELAGSHHTLMSVERGDLLVNQKSDASEKFRVPGEGVDAF